MNKILLAASFVCGLSSFAQMTTETNAVQMSTCDCYQLTNSTGQNGAIWSPNTIDLTSSFDYSFQVYLGSSAASSDGMAFVLQANGDGYGNIGYTLGYASPFGSANPVSANSIAVEIDTYNNNPTVPTDIASNHIGLSSALSVNHNLAGPFAIPSVEDGTYHTFRVIWTGSPLNTLTVLLDGNLIFTHTEDFVNTVFAANPNVYFGWTGSTGFADQQVVCTYRNAAFTSDLTSVCPELPVIFTDGSTSDLNSVTSWAWDFDDGSPIDNTQNPIHTWNTPGTYTVELTMLDPFDCPAVVTTNITVLPDITLNMDSVETTCFGDLDGQASAVPTNGTGPYVYSWNDPSTQTTQTATGLTPNQFYVVTVADALGCTGSDSVFVTEPAEIFLDMSGSNVLCFGGSDGWVTADAVNGVMPLNYLWNDGASQTTDTANGLSSGTYTVLVTDANGCTATDSVSITEPTAITITGTTSYDNGTNNGGVDATVTGGTGPYSYSWDSGETTEDLSNVASGDYWLTVTDANGCVDSLLFNVPSSVGLSQLNVIGFEIYPNPTTGWFTIKGSGDFNLQILDLSGRLVFSDVTADNMEIDLTAFERGIYLVQINKDGQYFTEKLILQ